MTKVLTEENKVFSAKLTKQIMSEVNKKYFPLIDKIREYLSVKNEMRSMNRLSGATGNPNSPEKEGFDLKKACLLDTRVLQLENELRILINTYK